MQVPSTNRLKALWTPSSRFVRAETSIKNKPSFSANSFAASVVTCLSSTRSLLLPIRMPMRSESPYSRISDSQFLMLLKDSLFVMS
jgi:hypothetical protein